MEYCSKEYGAGIDNGMLFEGCPRYKKSLHPTPIAVSLNDRTRYNLLFQVLS